MKNTFILIWEITKVVIVALLVVLPIRYFVFQPFFVRGASMEPNFYGSDYLIIDEISYRFQEPQRGEVIVFKYPYNPSQRYIKRIIGLPYETVEIKDGKIVIYRQGQAEILDESGYLPQSAETRGEERIALGQNEYFVLGDNRLVSSDSRSWGLLPEKDIVGRVIFRAWPFAALAKIDVP